MIFIEKMKNYKKFIFKIFIIGIFIFTGCSDDDAEDARNCFSCQFDPESFLYDDLNGVDLCEGMEVENIDGSMVTLTAADIAEFKPIYEEYGGTCN